MYTSQHQNSEQEIQQCPAMRIWHVAPRFPRKEAMRTPCASPANPAHAPSRWQRIPGSAAGAPPQIPPVRESAHSSDNMGSRHRLSGYPSPERKREFVGGGRHLEATYRRGEDRETPSSRTARDTASFRNREDRLARLGASPSSAAGGIPAPY
jgi:hypothetical protein